MLTIRQLKVRHAKKLRTLLFWREKLEIHKRYEFSSKPNQPTQSEYRRSADTTSQCALYTTSSCSLAHYTSAKLDAMVSTEQVIHLLRAATDTFPSLTARSSHKYISSDDKRWQKMLHKFTTNSSDADLNFISALFAQGNEMTWDEKQLFDFELHHCSVFG